MTALQDAIQLAPNWRTASPAELLTALTETQHVPKPESARVWSIAGIAKEYGVTVAETIYGALQANGLAGIAARFAATGLDTTDPQWLTNADAIIASQVLDPHATAEEQQALKFIGFNSVTLWTDPLTEAEITTARQAALDADRLINAVALFSERMTVGGDPAAVWAQAWTDAEA